MSSCCGPGNVSNNSIITSSANKIIKLSGDKLVAQDGVNVLASLNLCGLGISFDQMFRSQIRIPKKSIQNSTQYFNSLGVQVTFVSLKATYDKANKILDDNYLAYYFDDQPEIIRNFGTILLLTGTEAKPVPPIYLNNDSEYDVLVDVLAATTNVTFESQTQINSSGSVDNLKYTDLLSDLSSGDLVIYSNNVPVAYLQLDKIASIELSGRIIIIDDFSVGEFKLTFIDEFNANQANSLLNWVMNDRSRRITVSTGADLTPPAINILDTFNQTILIDSFATSSGYSLSKRQLLDLIVEDVVDNRDGEIILDESNIIVTSIYSNLSINSITEVGRYNVTLQVEDEARNRTLDTFVINVKDSIPAKIILKSVYSNMIKNGILIGFDSDTTTLPENRIWVDDFSFKTITKQNLIDLFVESVIDSTDGSIPLLASNINVTISITNIIYNQIVSEGDYDINFSIIDSDNNSSSQLWENINTELRDNLNQLVSTFRIRISKNQAPNVTFISSSPVNLNLYQFDINGILNKIDLYNYLVDTVTDDRTPSGSITLIQNRIFNQSNSDELLFIDSIGQYHFLTQHLDQDGAISTDTITINVTI